jgi:hypothetical protein
VTQGDPGVAANAPRPRSVRRTGSAARANRARPEQDRPNRPPMGAPRASSPPCPRSPSQFRHRPATRPTCTFRQPPHPCRSTRSSPSPCSFLVRCRLAERVQAAPARTHARNRTPLNPTRLDARQPTARNSGSRKSCIFTDDDFDRKKIVRACVFRVSVERRHRSRSRCALSARVPSAQVSDAPTARK